jgi:hypothetical protein
MEDGLEVFGRGLCGDFFADALGAECGFGIGLDLLNVGVDGQSAAGEGCLVLELVRAPGPEDVVVHRVFVLKNQFKIGPKPLLFIPGTPRLIRGNYFLD